MKTARAFREHVAANRTKSGSGAGGDAGAGADATTTLSPTPSAVSSPSFTPTAPAFGLGGGADEENIRLVTSFNDIFVTIAVIIMLFSVFQITNDVFHTADDMIGGSLVAAIAWGLAEYFTRKKRMALPSILLLIAFSVGLFFGLRAIIDNILPLDTSDTKSTLSVALAALATAAANYFYWKRFTVPIAVAAGTVAMFIQSAIADGVLDVKTARAFREHVAANRTKSGSGAGGDAGAGADATTTLSPTPSAVSSPSFTPTAPAFGLGGGADEENIRLVTSFNDIFVTIAVIIMLFSVFQITNDVFHTADDMIGGSLVAAIAWGLAEYFTRKNAWPCQVFYCSSLLALGCFWTPRNHRQYIAVRYLRHKIYFVGSPRRFGNRRRQLFLLEKIYRTHRCRSGNGGHVHPIGNRGWRSRRENSASIPRACRG